MKLTDHTQDEILYMAADLVSAFVSNNVVHAAELPDLIGTVYSSLAKLSSKRTEEAAPVAQLPAVPIKKSVTDDFIISLEDGKKFKSLRRHLQASYGMTPDQYRAKWGLPRDYPMVAPAYAAKRSDMAKAIGLGNSRKGPVGGGTGAAEAGTAKTAANDTAPAAERKPPKAPAKRRGRPSKKAA